MKKTAVFAVIILCSIMMAATLTKRIEDLTELTVLRDGDFFLVSDSSTQASRKIRGTSFIRFFETEGMESVKIDTLVSDTQHVIRSIGFDSDSSKIASIEARNLFDVSRNDTITGQIRYRDTLYIDSMFALKDTVITTSASNINKTSILKELEDSYQIVTAERGIGIRTRSAIVADTTLLWSDAGQILVSAADSMLIIEMPNLNNVDCGAKFMFHASDASNYINIIDTTNAGFSLLAANDSPTIGDTITFDNTGDIVILEASGLSGTDAIWLVTGGTKITIH